MNTTNFDALMQELTSSSVDSVEQAIVAFGKLGDRRAIPHLLEMLTNVSDDNLRNQIALSLGDLRADEAVPDIIALIKKPELINKRGSLVYALQHLDCVHYFGDIVELICTGNYEVCVHAHSIFAGLVDNVSYDEKISARRRLTSQLEIQSAISSSKFSKYDRIAVVRDALELLD